MVFTGAPTLTTSAPCWCCVEVWLRALRRTVSHLWALRRTVSHLWALRRTVSHLWALRRTVSHLGVLWSTESHVWLLLHWGGRRHRVERYAGTAYGHGWRRGGVLRRKVVICDKVPECVSAGDRFDEATSKAFT